MFFRRVSLFGVCEMAGAGKGKFPVPSDPVVATGGTQSQGIPGAEVDAPGAPALSHAATLKIRGTADPLLQASFQEGGALPGEVRFDLLLSLLDTQGRRTFECKATLTASVNGAPAEQSLNLPSVEDSPAANDRLGEQAEAALGELAAALLSRSDS